MCQVRFLSQTVPKNVRFFDIFLSLLKKKSLLTSFLVVTVNKFKPKSRPTDKIRKSRCFIDWSANSDYLAIKTDQYPNIVFVMEMGLMTLHSMISTDREIKDLKFKGDMLFFVWGTPNFAIWQDEMLAIANPFFGTKSFKCSKICWTEDGRQMAIKSKSELCLYYPNDDYRQLLLPST